MPPFKYKQFLSRNCNVDSCLEKKIPGAEKFSHFLRKLSKQKTARINAML